MNTLISETKKFAIVFTRTYLCSDQDETIEETAGNQSLIQRGINHPSFQMRAYNLQTMDR